MSQRELKVKVSSEIDDNLTKLLSILKSKKDYVLNVKAKLVDDGLKDFDKKLNGKSKSLKVNYDTSGFKDASKDFAHAESQIDKLNNKPVKIDVNSASLKELGDTLDGLASKVVSFTGRSLVAGAGNIIENTKGLYDAQNSFVTQMGALGRDDSHIESNLKSITEFGKKTKFSIEELTALMGDLDAQGWENASDLTKNLATISAMAPDSAQAIKTVSREIRQVSKNGALMNGDWNRIRNQIGGYSASKLEEYFRNQNYFGEASLNDAFANKKITGEEFLKAVNAVASEDELLKKYVTQTTTLGSALDNLKESFYATFVGTPYDKGELSKVYDDTVKFINSIQDDIPYLAKSIGQLIDVGRGIFKDIFGDFNLKDNVEGLKVALAPLIGGLQLMGKALGIVTNNGKNVGFLIGSIVTASAGYITVRKFAKALKLIQGLSGLALPSFGKGKGGAIPAEGVGDGMANAKAGVLNMVKNAGMILAVAGSVKLIASAMKDLDSVDMSAGHFLKNMAQMAIMVGGFMVTAGLIGKAMQKSPQLQTALIQGSLTLVGISGALWVITKIMGDLNNIDFDGGKVGKALMEMGAILAVFATISGLVGAFAPVMSAMVVGGVVLAGLAGIMLVLSVEMIAIAHAGKEFMKVDLPSGDELGKQVEKLIAFMEAVTLLTAISGIASIVNIPAGFFGTLGNIFSMANLETLKGVASTAMSLLDTINQLPDGDTVTKAFDKYVKLYKAMDTLQQDLDKANGNDFVNFLDGITNMFSGFGDSMSIDAISTSITNAMAFFTEVDKFDIPDLEGTKEKIRSIQSFINEITTITTTMSTTSDGKTVTTSNGGSWFGAIASGFKAEEVENVIDSLKNVVDLLNSVADMDLADAETIKTKITTLTTAIDTIGEKLPTSKNIFSAMIDAWSSGFDNDKTQNVLKTLNSAIDLVKKMSKVEIPDETTLNDKLDKLSKALTKIKDMDIPKLDEIDKQTAKTIETLNTFVDNLKSLIDKIAGVGEIDISQNIVNIETALTQISNLPSHEIFSNEAFSEKGFSEKATKISTFISGVATIATALQTIQGVTLDPVAVGTVIDAITTSLAKIAIAPEMGYSLTSMGDKFKDTDFTPVTTFITSLKDAGVALSQLPTLDEATILANIGVLERALDKIVTFSKYTKEGEGLGDVVSKVEEIKTAITGLANSLGATGELAGDNFADGFTGDAGIGSKLLDKVKSQKEEIEKLDWTSTGTNASTSFTDAFDVSGVLTKVQSIQDAINNLQGKTIDISINETTYTKKVKRENGGIIPEYHSTGGVIGRGWRQSGTDTVPAMLTAGEYVMKRSVTSYLGKSFMDSLNQMNLHSALTNLANRLGQSVVNNTYNNITQNVDNNASFVNGLGAIRRVVRP